MYTESVLLESRSARSGMSSRVEALDKVKALALAPDGVHATTQDVADYFEVSEKAVYNLLSRHREELKLNGLKVLRGAELREYETFNLRVSSEAPGSYPQQRNSLAVYTRRTVLNVAMLLRDSAVARRVRGYLLDAEEHARGGSSGCVTVAAHTALATRTSALESTVAEIGPLLQELGTVVHRMSVRLERMDLRLMDVERRSVNTERLVGELSHRVTGIRVDLDKLVRDRPPERHRRRHR